jgi:hypothetical protein
MKGFKISPVHLPPIKKVKVKRTHYRLLLFTTSCVVLIAHHYVPEHDDKLAFALNLLFVIDPTV